MGAVQRERKTARALSAAAKRSPSCRAIDGTRSVPRCVSTRFAKSLDAENGSFAGQGRVRPS